MNRYYFTRLILPVAFVIFMISIPFVWFPNIPGTSKSKPPITFTQTLGTQSRVPPILFPDDSSGQNPSTLSGKSSTPPSEQITLQHYMTLGFALFLFSVMAGGVILYGITRRQTASFRKRFAPRKAPAQRNNDK